MMEEKGKDGKKSENGDISLTEARRTLKRNGYQLVSQKNGKQKWKRDEGDSGVTLPCGDGVVESSDWNSVVESQGLDTDF
jgi:hypothetical protein